MSTSTIGITLTPRRNLDEQFWIALEQIEEEKLATLAEAAEVIDALFLIDPCVPVDTPPTEEQHNEQQLDRDARLAAMAKRYYDDIAPELQEKLCSDNQYLAQVKLTRSHQDRNYNLLIEGGELIQTMLGTETVVKSIKVENSDILDADLPADKEISAAWLGPCWTDSGILSGTPEIYVHNGRVYWDGNVSGSIQLVYEQDYAMLTIAADREGCELTGLYHLSVDAVSVSAPEFDDAARGFCSSLAARSYRKEPEEGDCYIETLHRKVCDCSGNQAGSHRTQRPAPCPEKTPIGTVIAFEDEVEYVSCNEVEQVNDSDYYEQKCCEPPDVDLPRCREITRTFTGKGIGEEKRAELQRTYGDDVQIVLVGPDQPPCGKMIYEQQVNARNCCDGVPELLWDHESSADVITDGSSAWVFVTDTGGPYFWKVRGQGFWANGAYTQRDVVTEDPRLKVYTKNSCGVCWISVDDGCSGVSGVVRSTEGSWEQIYLDTGGAVSPEMPCPVMIPMQIGSSQALVTGIKDEWRISQTFDTKPCTDGSGFAIRSSLAGILSYCESQSNIDGCDAVSYENSNGSCFETTPNCIGCDNECVGEEYQSTYADGGTLGLHSMYWQYSASEWWSFTRWVVVTLTKMEKWSC